ncbi:HNH endonuclease signature motif containing protein [Clostridium sp. AL.422]|uniref:HNH endonuclease n=1 Tax=Clostridium TaxID=1485 RepID=UPI00293DBEBF|nr:MULTISPECIES: HNH endonuclease signature motif containing protein [unclassified Clostridium]MDV4150065.1 HNH endonuclease signature motif containing protein [Clostridium sp. AL.422]
MENENLKNIVISIPASGTIDLIYKYQIHAHPDKVGYEYKDVKYYTFRKKGGIMDKLFEIEKIITINPYNIDEIKEYNLTSEIENRLKKYIEERLKSFEFEHKGINYKFYILNYKEKLEHNPKKPSQNNHCYITLDELHSGKEFVDTVKLSESESISMNQLNNKENLMWTFFSNPKYWYVDDFLNSDKVNGEIYYSINKDHRDKFKIGDRGVIRVGIDSRNKSELYGKEKMKSGIYAVVKVMSIPEFIKDDYSEFYANKDDINIEKWRIKIKIIKNLINSPIIFNEENKVKLDQDKYLISGFQRATMPLKEEVFYRILKLINSNNSTNINRYEEIIDIKNLGNSIVGIEFLNEIYENTNIEQKERLVKVIERGRIANKIKKYIKYKCQICESLGLNPYSFKKKNGEYYVETHHIIPVSDSKNSKLSVDNLICLCPNHHRELHYGNVKIINNNDTYVEYNLDGTQVKIDKIKFNK